MQSTNTQISGAHCSGKWQQDATGRWRARGMRDARFRRRAKMGIMSKQVINASGQPKLSGALSLIVVHVEILHIKSVIQRLSVQDLRQLGLPPAYWRKRLQELMRTHQLSKSQVDEIDRLLVMLKE
ncbi:MAG TPA: hypothetical protein VJU59_12150 [Paraburkholderia sp.]|uniref:hypothetical protein n=1 Tax=Paraburkholderia sp. TaxID=1926495 RepID=UPI002B49A714|nr:hypothetical protein [Paraburkholderia sp.]HKR40410.1 hypothetical protein [Paraburkholderia sp.]